MRGMRGVVIHTSLLFSRRKIHGYKEPFDDLKFP
jgi:hypothetical protein